MEKQVDLKDLSDVELKALGYDQVKLLQITQANLSAIEQELKSRAVKGQGKELT